MVHKDISNEDLSYVAGLFDGEGCVFVTFSNKNKRKNKLYGLQSKLIITNTNLDVLEWCRSLFGRGHLILNQCKSRVGKGHKPCYRFILESNASLEVASLIFPYLKIKNKQVEHLIKFLESRKNRPNNSAYNIDELFNFFECKKLLQDEKEFITVSKIKYSFDEFVKLILSTRKNSDYKVFEWDNESIALLGTNTDDIVAEKLGVKRPVVQRKRKQLKIKPFKSFRDTSFYI